MQPDPTAFRGRVAGWQSAAAKAIITSVLPHPMTSLIVHAGLPRTGTTHLQTHFANAANRAWLADRGIAYPSSGRGLLAGHHELARLVRAGDREGAAAVFESLRQSGPPRTLLSSEEFSGLTADQVRTIFELAEPAALDWVLVIRRRSAACLSRWREDIKHGLAESLPEYIASQVLGAGDVLRPETTIVKAVEALGAERVTIVVYDRLDRSSDDAIVAWFLRHVLELPNTTGFEFEARRQNRSLDPALLEAARTLNRAAAAGARYAPGRAAFAKVAIAELRSGGADAAELLARAAAALEHDARPLDLTGLDREWLTRDYEVLQHCRDRVLNLPQEASTLFPDAAFPDAASASANVLPPEWPQDAPTRAIVAALATRCLAAARER